MMYAIVVFLVVVGIPIFDYLFRRPVLRALLSCLTPIFYVAVPAAETAYEKMEETYDTLSLSVNDFVEANSPVMMEAREQLRDRLMLLTGSKMPQPNFDAAAAGGRRGRRVGHSCCRAAARRPCFPAGAGVAAGELARVRHAQEILVGSCDGLGQIVPLAQNPAPARGRAGDLARARARARAGGRARARA